MGLNRFKRSEVIPGLYLGGASVVGGLGYTGTGGLLPFVGNSGTHRQRLRSPGVGEGWQTLRR